MNILFLTEDESNSPGGWIHVYSTALELARLGHGVKLICKDGEAHGEITRKIDNGTLSIRRVKSSGRFHTILYPFQLLFYGTKYIVTRKIDIIYERPGIVPVGFLLSKLFKKPLVIAAQGVAYYEHESKVRSQMVDSKLLARRMVDNKLLANKFVMAILKGITRINHKNAYRIITVTPQIKQLICIQYKINPDKIIVLSNGADINLFRPMETEIAKKLLKLDEAVQYVCFVGNLLFWQGVQYLIKSAPLVLEKYPSARFLIVGDGMIKKELMNLAQQEKVFDKFLFYGAVPHEDVPTYINASEVCVCTAASDDKNKTTGNSGLKVFEYMACGKPVVIGNTEGQKDVIAESSAGLVVSPEHSRELASAIISLLKDAKLSKQLGENGRKVVVERYSWAGIAGRVSEVFGEAVRKQA